MQKHQFKIGIKAIQNNTSPLLSWAQHLSCSLPSCTPKVNLVEWFGDSQFSVSFSLVILHPCWTLHPSRLLILPAVLLESSPPWCISWYLLLGDHYPNQWRWWQQNQLPSPVLHRNVQTVSILWSMSSMDKLTYILIMVEKARRKVANNLKTIILPQ